MLIPQHLEQYLVAQSVVRLGAGRVVSLSDAGEVVTGLREVVEKPRFAEAARAFAARYARHEPKRTLEEIVSRIEQLASGDSA